MPSNDQGHLSHYPILAAALARTTGPVLELGMGWGSSPMLHAMCRLMKRTLASYETNREWYELFAWMDEPRHWVSWVPDIARAQFPILDYDVAFIDFAPGEPRRDVALGLAERARFILLHDAEQDPPHGGGNYQYETIIPQFKYHEFYRVVRPHTLILSNYEPFGLSPGEQEPRLVL